MWRAIAKLESAILKKDCDADAIGDAIHDYIIAAENARMRGQYRSVQQSDERLHHILKGLGTACRCTRKTPKVGGVGRLGLYIKESDVDPEQLKMGIDVEMEHTTDRLVAKQIALDHLAELRDYYTRLKKMESDR